MEIINKNNMIMKKLAILGMGLCIALAFSSCKSSESAYKKAYEKAKQQELAEPQNIVISKNSYSIRICFGIFHAKL